MFKFNSKTALLTTILVFSQPLIAMQAAKAKKAHVPRHRQGCCKGVTLKDVGKGILVIGGAVVCYIARQYGEIHPGCPAACNDAATRHTDPKSEALVKGCNAIAACPEIEYLSFREQQLNTDFQAP